MTFMKFTSHFNAEIYVDISSVKCIRRSYKPNIQGQSFSAGSTTGTLNTYYGDDPGNTVLTIEGNMQIYVEEHISEVLAMIEGRDPRPAKVLFGKT